MEKMNIFVKVCGEYPKIEKYLKEHNGFNTEENDDTLYIYVGNSVDLKDIKEKNVICFTNSVVPFSYMKCIDIEQDVINSLNVFRDSNNFGIINITLGNIIDSLLNTKEFSIIRKSGDVLSSLMTECTSLINDFNINDINKTFFIVNANEFLTFDELSKTFELVVDTLQNKEIIHSYCLNRILTKQILNLILIK